MRLVKTTAMEAYNEHEDEDLAAMEEYDPRDYEDGVDEDMEAVLYSMVHYKCDNTMEESTEAPQYSFSSDPDMPWTFSVTTFTEEHSDISAKDSARSTTVSVKKNSLSVKNAQHDGKNGTRVHETSGGDSAMVDIQSKSNIQRDASPKTQKPEVIHVDSTSDSEISEEDSGHSQPKKGKFDLEAELGIPKSSKKQKPRKTKHDKNTPVQTSKSPPPKSPDADIVEVEESASPAENSFMKTLNQLLADRSHVKKVKDVVVIKSDGSSSSSSSSSSGENESEGNEENKSSSDSSSDSDIEVLGSATVDQSVNSSAARLTLDLNWNVNSVDRRTVESVEKRSSQVDESLWKINDADMVAATKSLGSRYYAKKEVRCRNCDKEGHLSKVCPEPKKRPNCSLCGLEGHLMRRCPNRLCSNCSQPGHKYFNCPMPKKARFAKCARCQAKGHTEDLCPDHWRQYHLTTTTSEDLTKTKRKVNSRAFCCNCAKEGHFAYECRKERMDKFIFPSNPFVCRYEVASSKKKEGNGKFHDSSQHQTWPEDLESEDTPRRKKFNYHDSFETPMGRSQGLYPRGSRRAGHRNEPCNQRYFSTHSSSHSTPQQQAPPSHRSQEKGIRNQEGRAGKKPHLSVSSRKFTGRIWRGGAGRKMDSRLRRKMDSLLRQSFEDSCFDWRGEEDTGHVRIKSRRRPSPHDGKEVRDGFDEPPPPKKKKKDKTGDDFRTVRISEQGTRDEAEPRKKRYRRRKRPRKKQNQGPHNFQPSHQDNTQFRNKQQHTSHEGQQKQKTWSSKDSTSGNGQKSLTIVSKDGFRTAMETTNCKDSTSGHRSKSLTITSKGGFRTTMKTMNYNRNSYNTQQR